MTIRAIRAIIAIALLSCSAVAQEQLPVRPSPVRNSRIVRSYQLSSSGNPTPAYPSAPTLEVDFSQSPPGADATFSANTGQTLTQKGAGISRVTDGTWPAGTSGTQGYEWTFNGTTNYITSTIGPPAGDFSVMCVVMPTASTADATIVGSFNTSSKRGWRMYQSTTSAGFDVSDDGSSSGGHMTSVTVASAFSVGRVSIVIGTYDYVSDGASVMKLYADALTAGSSTSADGPVYSGADYLSVGANGNGASFFAGTISHCTYWDGVVLSAAQAATIRNAWLGVLSTSGVPVSTTSATPPALMVSPRNAGTEPYLRQYGANLNTISNNGTCSGLYGASAVTNLIRRSLFRTWNGGDGGTGCGDYPTGWAAYCAAGDGTVSISKDATTKAVDVYSTKMTLTGTTSGAYIYSNCRTAEIGQNVKITTEYKCTSGSCTSKIFFRQFTAAANCTGAYTDVFQTCTGATWGKCTLTHLAAAWAGGTQSYRVLLTETGDGGVTSKWSAPQMRANATSVPLDIDQFCGTDADADATCTTTVNSTASPYSANGPMTTTVTGCSPWAGTDLAAAVYVVADGNATAGNTSSISVSSSTDEAAWTVYDATPASKYISPDVSNWSALTAYALKASGDGAGNLRLWWNNAWQTTSAGAGTGIRSAAQATTYLSGSNSDGGDIYIRDLTIYRRVLP